MSRKREATGHPDVGSGRHGLMVVDIQTLHDGHVYSMMRMRMTCETGTVAIGSNELSGVEGHPFSFAQRVDMVKGVFGDAFRFLALNDIDASQDKRAWYAYVRRKMIDAGLPDPTDYFCGSLVDASWYVHAFADPDRHPSVAKGPVTTWTNEETGRRLHVIDRHLQDVPSGRDVRLMIEFRDPRWKLHVPEVLHRYVERHYPPRLRQPISFDEVLDVLSARPAWGSEADPIPAMARGRTFAEMQAVEVDDGDRRVPLVDAVMERADFLTCPVGTRISVAADEASVYELKDDGKWRPLPTLDEKARYAREQRRTRLYGASGGE